jgi:GTP-binding protein
MFVDTAAVFIRSGHGGRGCMSFRREKYLPRGGPDGGDGGDGGSVFFVGDINLNTLSRFRHTPKLVAQNGKPGGSNNCSGKKGKDLLVKVPCGTIVRNADTEELLCEILEPGVRVLLAPGGAGGRGNQHFATSVNQAPHHVEEGKPGVSFAAGLELKVIADVGLLGLPNAGKSSLITAVSRARPKIAGYPFTTLRPHLGVIERPDFRSIVIADIPGIIEGAAEGKGLGIQFLKHVERTRVLLAVVDISEFADPPADKAFNTVLQEIKKFGRGLDEKKMLIAANKIDLDPDRTFLDLFMSGLSRKHAKLVFPVSAATRKGLDALITALDRALSAD